MPEFTLSGATVDSKSVTLFPSSKPKVIISKPPHTHTHTHHVTLTHTHCLCAQVVNCTPHLIESGTPMVMYWPPTHNTELSDYSCEQLNNTIMSVSNSQYTTRLQNNINNS